MKPIQFKCTLLSDVIINQKAATEGNQQTLDFIPGSAFLGVAAGSLYKDKSPESMLLFHSGKVRFGDAHPLVENMRAIRIPASWYFKKDDKIKEQPFVHHGMSEEGLKDDNGNPVQIKQCRGGFMIKNGEILVSEVQINKHFAIKSAYDSQKRRSEDQKMYGYESLEAGSVWCFEVTLDQDMEQFSELLIGVLVGKKRIGRSSTAQYGLVEIESCIFDNPFKIQQPIQVKVKHNEVPSILLYAESRLIFFDEFGQPTFTPTEQQLGLTKGKIDWAKSQIRTFQYAPYNKHRKTRDADRCGIEKGSVFCVTDASFDDIEKGKMAKGIGLYLNEGFGKILINPEFLEYKREKAKAKFKFEIKPTKANEKPKEPNRDLIFENKYDSEVWKYLIYQFDQSKAKAEIYSAVNVFVNSPFGKSFVGKEKFASQWGTIRSIATQIRTKNVGLSFEKEKDLLIKKLFEENEDSITKKKIGIGYLKHGVGLEKWEHKSEQLEKFISKLNPKQAIEIMINLAAEMAKKCRRNQP